jgi:hypothetical protein
MNAELAQKEPEPIKLNASGLVKCETTKDLLRLASGVFKSSLAPSGFKSELAVLVAMQMGAELGLHPMQSLQCIAVVNNKPTIYGKALPGIVLKHNLIEIFEEWFEGDGLGMVAVCKVKRKGIESVRVEKFTAQDAKAAGLWGKAGPWSQYPKDMLRYKARARAFNALFADVLCGLPVAEDYQDVPASKGTEPPPAPIHDPLLDKQETITATLTPDEDLSFDGDIPAQKGNA